MRSTPSWAVCGAVVGLLLAAALCCPSDAHAVTYYSDAYFDVVVNDQSVVIGRNESALPTSVAGVGWYVSIYYDWAYDGSWQAHMADLDDIADYAGLSSSVAYEAKCKTVALPLDPRYEAYYLWVRLTGADGTVYGAYHVVVNRRAEVIVSNEEPTPVRIQEIGLASEASTLAPDVLPTSLDASVSVDGTLPVAVESILGESDGEFLWAVVGGLVGIGGFVAVRRVAHV